MTVHALVRMLALLVAALAWTTGLGVAPTLAEKRALVIGNNDYAGLGEGGRLKTAVNDARAVRGTLDGLGFKVSYHEDLDRSRFEDAIFEFSLTVEEGDVVLFYYAGHGVTVDGQNRYLPVDITQPDAGRPHEDARLKQRSVAEASVVDTLLDRKPSAIFAIVDACRVNPLAGTDAKRAVGGSGGLVKTEKPDTLFLYAAGVNQAALDRFPNDDGGGNSPFTRVLIEELTVPGLDLLVLAGTVQRKVGTLVASHGFEQTPGITSQLRGQPIYLAGEPRLTPGTQRIAVGGNSQAPLSDALRRQRELREGEETFWKSVENSNDPQQLSMYLVRYPSGLYADLARARLATFDKAQAAAAEAEKARADELAHWTRVEASAEPQALRDYIAAWPNGAHLAQARVRLDSLEKEASALARIEEELFGEIASSRDRRRMQDYIARFPDGRYAQAVQTMLAQGERQSQAQAEQVLAAELAQQRAEQLKQMKREEESRRETERLIREQQERLAMLQRELDNQVKLRRVQPVEEPRKATADDSCGMGSLVGMDDHGAIQRQLELYYADLSRGSKGFDCGKQRWGKALKETHTLFKGRSDAQIWDLSIDVQGDQASVGAMASVKFGRKVYRGPVTIVMEKQGDLWKIMGMR